MLRVMLAGAIVLSSTVVTAADERYFYWPNAPARLPYYPPLKYGPGNHFPYPFQEWYPGHPYAHLYYPYLYTPYSAYYAYPTFDVYGKSYNPFAPPVPFRVPTLIQPHGAEALPVAPQPLPAEGQGQKQPEAEKKPDNGK